MMSPAERKQKAAEASKRHQARKKAKEPIRQYRKSNRVTRSKTTASPRLQGMVPTAIMSKPYTTPDFSPLKNTSFDQEFLDNLQGPSDVFDINNVLAVEDGSFASGLIDARNVSKKAKEKRQQYPERDIRAEQSIATPSTNTQAIMPAPYMPSDPEFLNHFDIDNLLSVEDQSHPSIPLDADKVGWTPFTGSSLSSPTTITPSEISLSSLTTQGSSQMGSNAGSVFSLPQTASLRPSSMESLSIERLTTKKPSVVDLFRHKQFEAECNLQRLKAVARMEDLWRENNRDHRMV